MHFRILTPLERKVMEMILAGDHPVLDVLRSQLSACHVLERTFTGVGFFTKFHVPPHTLRIKAKRLVIDDVGGEIPDYYDRAHPWVCHFVLFIQDGVIDTLEGATPDDEWTSEEDRIVVKYYTTDARHTAHENQRDWSRLLRILEEAD